MPSPCHLVTFVAALLTTAGLLPATAAESASVPTAALSTEAFRAALAGSWSGTLEYRDYQAPHARVFLPTIVAIQPATDARALEFAYLYDDGPTKKVRSTDVLALDSVARSLTWTSGYGRTTETYAVTADSRAGQLTLLGPGRDGDRPAQIRITLRYDSHQLSIVKETALPGAEFLFRHRYLLKRSAPAQS